jgi:hypothetical protein
VVIVTGHRSLDYDRVVEQAARVIDTCNVTAGVDGDKDNVLRLGAG